MVAQLYKLNLARVKELHIILHYQSLFELDLQQISNMNKPVQIAINIWMSF